MDTGTDSGKADWATRDALWPTQHLQRLENELWVHMPWWKMKLGAQLASRGVYSQWERFHVISRDSRLTSWETQIRENHVCHREDLPKAGLVTEQGPAEILGVQGLC